MKGRNAPKRELGGVTKSSVPRREGFGLCDVWSCEWSVSFSFFVRFSAACVGLSRYVDSQPQKIVSKGKKLNRGHLLK
jgi:hypothetical protein